MDTNEAKVHRVERVDDLPVLLATLKEMNVAEILDRHFPTGHRWKGELTFGEVACVWICYVASEGDHRLSELEPWRKTTSSPFLLAWASPFALLTSRTTDSLTCWTTLPSTTRSRSNPSGKTANGS